MAYDRQVIIIDNIDGKALTTSRHIAEIFNKNHNHIRRDIKEILEMSPKLDTSFKEVDYNDSMNRKQKEYLIDRDGFSLLAMGFTGKESLDWKLKYIEAFNKMEEQLKNQVPQISEKEQMLLKLFSKDQVEVAQAHNRIVEIEVEEATTPLIETIQEQTPKVEYFENVLNSDKLITVTDIAKDLAMSGTALNKILNENGIIYPKYKNKFNKKKEKFIESISHWIPYAEYNYLIKDGYADYKISNFSQQLMWTEKGRKFIIDLVNSLNK